MEEESPENFCITVTVNTAIGPIYFEVYNHPEADRRNVGQAFSAYLHLPLSRSYRFPISVREDDHVLHIKRTTGLSGNTTLVHCPGLAEHKIMSAVYKVTPEFIANLMNGEKMDDGMKIAEKLVGVLLNIPPLPTMLRLSKENSYRSM